MTRILPLAAVLAGLATTSAAEPMPFRSVTVELPMGDRSFPGGQEAEAINSNCLACHSAGMVLTQPRLTRTEWQAEIEKMIHAYKAPVDPSDIPKIVNYLTRMKVDGAEMTHQDVEAVRIQSAFGFEETLKRLRSALEVTGFTIFAVIDHRSAAQSVGLAMPPTTVLVFGNPRGGTPLMLAAPDFALELPLRVLIREDESGRALVVYNAAKTLDGKHDLPAGMAERLAPAGKVIAEAVSASAAAP